MTAQWAFANSLDGATDAFAYWSYDTSGVGLTELYLSVDFSICQDLIDNLEINCGGCDNPIDHTQDFWRIVDLYGLGGHSPIVTDPETIARGGGFNNLWLNGNGKFSDEFGEFGPLITTAGIYTVQVHMDIPGESLAYKINGTLYDRTPLPFGLTWADLNISQIDAFVFGSVHPNFNPVASTDLTNFTNVLIGSTDYGTSDIFSDDFASGDFSAWTGTFGTMTVNAAPSCTGPILPKVVFTGWSHTSLRIQSGSEGPPGPGPGPPEPPGPPIPPPPPPPSPPPPPGPIDTSSYAAAISYSAPGNRPAWGGDRLLTFTNQTELENALGIADEGTEVRNVNVSGGFSISGEWAGLAFLNPTGIGIKVDFAIGANQVRWDGTPLHSNLPGPYIHDSSNLQIYGGIVNNAGGTGVQVEGGNSAATSNIRWWNLQVSNTGSHSLAMLPTRPAGGGTTAANTITGCDFQLVCGNWGQDYLTYDPHAEKGTGIHGVILADIDDPGHYGTFTNNRVAVNGNIGPTGACLEVGQDTGGLISGNQYYILAIQMNFVAHSQTAGNAMNIWGDSPRASETVQYIESHNCQGHAVDTTDATAGMYSMVTVEFGRSYSCCLNPHEPPPSFMTNGSVVYVDIAES